MTTLILIAGLFCALAAALHVGSILVAMKRVRNAATRGSVLAANEGITIVRPVCGVENFSEQTLASAFHLDHPRYEILFCVADAADPVIPLVRRLMAAYPNVASQLLVGNDPISTNPKLNNIVKGWAAAKYRWIVMTDSNVLMPHDYLAQLVATWQGDTGLVCSPPVGCAPYGIWAELECTILNTYQARWQLFADSIGMGFAQGKNMLWRKDIMEKGGGIRLLASEVAEDAAATKLVRYQGLRVRLVDKPFEQPLGRRTATEIWQRQLRWARLRRDTFKLYFVLELFSGGIPPIVACLACAMAADLPVVATVTFFATGWYALELLLARAAGWYWSWRSPMLFIIRDLVLPVLWLASWVGNEFVWRGNQMRVANSGSPA
jgi:ceramide glucosyltransferase